MEGSYYCIMYQQIDGKTDVLPTDEPTDPRIDRLQDGRADEWTDQRTHRWTDGCAAPEVGDKVWCSKPVTMEADETKEDETKENEKRKVRCR